MKRFIISVLGVSVFFIGLSGLIETASAKFMQDEKAMQLIRASKLAIGMGEDLTGVKSMSITGAVTRFTESNGIPGTRLGGVEINFQMPDRFSKMLKFGDPGAAAGGGGIDKEIEVVVLDTDRGGAEPKDGENVFVIKKADGNVEWVSDEDEETDGGAHKVIVREESAAGSGQNGVRKYEVSTGAAGIEGSKIVVREESSTENFGTPVSEAEKKKMIHKKYLADFGPRRGGGGSEMLRLTTALLMTAPEGANVSYKFEGEGTVDGYPSNIVSVGSRGGTFRVYLDAATSLPRMISFMGPRGNVFFNKDEAKDLTREALLKIKEKMAVPVEHQIRFSDYRSVNGLLLPHRWAETVAGKQSRITDVTSFEINPANIADKFKHRKVFIKMEHPQTR